MANDIQSSFKELVGASAKPRSDAFPFAMLCLGVVVGLFIGYSMNLEKDAQIRADKDCGLCQDNIEIMVGNYNVLARTCAEAKQYARDIQILPGYINETVRVYAS